MTRRSWAQRVRQPSHQAVHRWAWAALVANIGIVITGAAVRLTASGMGCTTWPRCTPDSLVATGALGHHEYIEFGNRLLTFAVAVACLGSAWTAWRYRPAHRLWRGLSLAVLLGIPAQAVVGGISVRTHLNPWIVMLHMLISLGIIGLASWLMLRTQPGFTRLPVVHPALARLGLGLLAVLAVVVYLGSMVTGAGPHAGDAQATRIALDVALLSQLHADAVFLLVGFSVGLRGLLAVVKAPARTQRAFTWVLVVLVIQAVIGYTQYALKVPAVLVGMHVGAAAVLVAVTSWAVGSLWQHQSPTPSKRPDVIDLSTPRKETV